MVLNDSPLVADGTKARVQAVMLEMGYVYDRAADRSDLVLLDAQTMADVARVHLPARVPAGFHGNWAPTEG
jgi:carotenoid cleavage dioxygenase